jgi:hypothetical protein
MHNRLNVQEVLQMLLCKNNDIPDGIAVLPSKLNKGLAASPQVGATLP